MAARRVAVTGTGVISALGTCDAAHMSRPERDGQVRAMREALSEAQLSPAGVGYINAHGTATNVGDVVEAQAINALFGAAARDVRVSSTKSLHGHLLGGAGALEFAAAPPRAVMSNSFAFGGSNVVLIAERA